MGKLRPGSEMAPEPSHATHGLEERLCQGTSLSPPWGQCQLKGFPGQAVQAFWASQPSASREQCPLSLSPLCPGCGSPKLGLMDTPSCCFYFEWIIKLNSKYLRWPFLCDLGFFNELSVAFTCSSLKGVCLFLTDNY